MPQMVRGVGKKTKGLGASSQEWEGPFYFRFWPRQAAFPGRALGAETPVPCGGEQGSVSGKPSWKTQVTGQRPRLPHPRPCWQNSPSGFWAPEVHDRPPFPTSLQEGHVTGRSGVRQTWL